MKDLKALGEIVHKQSYERETGGTMMDLVFNPETGEFEQQNVAAGEHPSGMVVTEMTKEGFANTGHPSRAELYSRSAGLIENGALANKRAFIIGLGSFGGTIAVELAKAAVGEFAIMDFDRLETHNVVRHACSLKDVGRYKTDAVEELILGKNPYAHVDKLCLNVMDDPAATEREIDRADIVLVATDNNASRFLINDLLVKHRKVGIYGRANTRAEGGDVFVQRPDGPCYACLVGMSAFDQAAEEVSSQEAGLRSGHIAAYTAPEDAAAIIQVGLASDIAPITNLMVKLALVELARGTNSGISGLEGELVYDYWMWANRRERRFRNWASFDKAGTLPTILRWYGARIRKKPDCALCGRVGTLDSGEALPRFDFQDMADVDLALDDGEGRISVGE